METSERSEADIIAQTPITVRLGDQDHQVKLLVARDSRKWREESAKLLSKLPEYAAIDTEDPDKFSKGMSALLVNMPDKVIDLFFLYAQDLKRKEIEAVATDAQICRGFEQVAAVAFPFVSAVTKLADQLAK